MTQCERVLGYLQTHDSITPMQAWDELGIYRLGARIWDLKNKKGYNIVRHTAKVKNRFGETCKVAEYRLED